MNLDKAELLSGAKPFFFATVMFFSFSSQAIIVPSKAVFSRTKSDCSLRNSQSQNYLDLVQKVTIKGPSDDRLEDSSKKTNFSYKVVCEKKEGGWKLIGSSQLTKNNRTVSTAAHLFYDENCNERWNPKNCGILVYHNQGAEVIKFSKSQLGTTCTENDIGNDWAILKLSKKAPGNVVQICKSPDVSTGDALHVVSAADIDRNRSGPQRLVQDCKVIGKSDSDIKTDCDIASLNSGSAVLKEKCMVGMIRADHYVGYLMDYEEADPVSNYSQVVPINEKFRKSLNNFK